VNVKTELLFRGPRRGTRPINLAATVALVVGGALLVWSAYIHFHLWQSVGYRHIPTIGPLFLLQSIAGLVLGLLVIAARRVWAAVLGIGFAASTLVGFLLTVGLRSGLFNFKESWSAPFAHQAFGIELAAIVVLFIAGALSLAPSATTERAGTTPTGIVSAGA
jgi:hypothetical protein